MSGYRCIVADPPWKQKAGSMSSGGMGKGFVGGTTTSADLPYPPMSVPEIKALPVGDLAAPDCHLYLWATNKYLPVAFEVVKAWGFRYSTCIVWRKALIGGGLGGTWRVSTEFCLFAYRGRCDAKGVVRGTHFDWKRPYDERGKPKHSGKPPAFLDLVEQASHGPYLELFARVPRDGWDRWGNEVDSTVELAA